MLKGIQAPTSIFGFDPALNRFLLEGITIPDFLASDTLRLILKSDAPLSVQALRLASLDSFIAGLTEGQVIKGKVIEPLGQGKALVEFNGKQAVAELGRPHRRGEPLLARVEQTSPSPLFKLVSSRETIDTSKTKDYPSLVRRRPPTLGDRPANADRVQIKTPSNSGSLVQQKELAPLGLSWNQPAQGQVVKSLSPETALVRLAGQNITVTLPQTKPLQSGAPVEVRALPNPDGFILTGKLLKDPGVTTADLTKSLFSTRQPLSSLLTDLEKNIEEFFKVSSAAEPKALKPRISETLQLLSGKSLEKINKNWIENALDRSGFSYEAKVSSFAADPKNPALKQAVSQDLKGQLLELSRFLETQLATGAKGNESTLQSLLRQVNASLQHIEMHQLSHLISKQENQPLALQLPQFLEQEAQNLKVFFRREGEESSKSGQKKPGQYALAFFLDLSGLGAMRLDAKVQGQRLGLDLAMESEEALQFIAANFEGFQNHLKALGFDAEISGRVDKQDVHNVPDDLAPVFLQDLERLIDVRT